LRVTSSIHILAPCNEDERRDERANNPSRYFRAIPVLVLMLIFACTDAEERSQVGKLVLLLVSFSYGNPINDKTPNVTTHAVELKDSDSASNGNGYVSKFTPPFVLLLPRC
jgi:hypothetical protein